MKLKDECKQTHSASPSVHAPSEVPSFRCIGFRHWLSHYKCDCNVNDFQEIFLKIFYKFILLNHLRAQLLRWVDRQQLI